MVKAHRAAVIVTSLMIGWLMSACAAGGPIATPATVADTPETLAASDDSRVAASVWLVDQPKAVIAALHGYGDYGHLTFRRAAAYWQGRGIATYAPDQRGFGRNPSRGKWPGAEGLIEDAVAYLADIRARHPCAPLVLIGHSMGGGVALAAAGRGAEIDGLVLATPAIWGGERLNPLHRGAAWLAAMLFPEQRFSGRGVVRIQASDNIEALRELSRDPLYLSPPSAREIFGLVRLTDMARRSTGSVRIPALMLLGAKDQIVPNGAVRAVFSEVKGPRRVIEYPEGWHLVFRDHQAKTVWRDVADWIDAIDPACASTEDS